MSVTVKGQWPRCTVEVPASAAAGSAMDWRHIQIVANLVIGCEAREAVEVGCFRGGSTRAFLAGFDSGRLERLHLIDVRPLPELRALVQPYIDSGRAVLYAERSVDALPRIPHADLACLDGWHGLETVQPEVRWAVERGVQVIVVHDTVAAVGGARRAGSAWAKQYLSVTRPWLTIEDSAARPGEVTVRGLLTACRTPELFEIARQVYAAWVGDDVVPPYRRPDA